MYQSIVKTGCENLSAGGAVTILWLVAALAGGGVVGVRSAANLSEKNGMRAANWVAVVAAALGSATAFLYILLDTHHRCGSSSVVVFFALQPAALVGFATLFGAVAAQWLRSYRHDLDRRNDQAPIATEVAEPGPTEHPGD